MVYKFMSLIQLNSLGRDLKMDLFFAASEVLRVEVASDFVLHIDLLHNVGGKVFNQL